VLVEELKERWWKRVTESGLRGCKVVVSVRGLKPEEAIGRPLHGDYPILRGREVLIQAELEEAIGQAFTDEPRRFEGSLEDVHEMGLSSNGERAVFVAVANATYRYLGLVGNTVHCKDEGPETCGKKIAESLASLVAPETRLLMIGFQPSIAESLSRRFKNFRVTDMDPENVGRVKRGVKIESYEVNREAMAWSDAVIATGSTIVNSTIDEIIELCKGKLLMFYGVTIASAAYEFGLKRLCFSEELRNYFARRY
jgi:uncharacterized protein (DUF4213/DUF364 family)